MPTYAYLVDPQKQFQYRNGKNLTGGFLRVYEAGTDDRAVTYSNWNFSRNEDDIVLDDNGRAVIICDSEKAYRLEVYAFGGELLWTCEPLTCYGGGGGSVVFPGIKDIISTDGTVSVTIQGGTADLGISDTLLSGTRSAEAWKGTGVFENNGHGYFGYSAVETAVSGSGIYPQYGKVQIGRSGIYHVDAQINYAFTGAPSAFYSDLRFYGNGNVVGIDHFDISYNHSAGFHLGYDVWASAVPTEVNIGIGVENDDFSAVLQELQIHRVAQQFGYGGGGLNAVEHDSSLSGSGTHDKPLGISQQVLDAISGKQDASGMTSYVTNSAFSSYSSVVNSSITAIESSITSISSTVSGLTGTYIEQSASGMFQPSGNYVSADEMSSYVPFSGLEGDASGRITAISGSAVKGHEYTGIYPVNVDNTADQISVDHTGLSIDSDTMSSTLAGDQVVIGVKPGLFLEQSAFATASGQFLTAVPAGYATEGYVDSAVSGKLDVTASSQFLTALPADLAYTSDVASAVSGKLDASASSDFYPMTGNPSGFLTAHQSTAGLATEQYVDSAVSGKLDTTAYNSADFLLASQSGLFQGSGNYLSATESANYYPMTGNPSGFLTEHQELTGYLPVSAIGIGEL